MLISIDAHYREKYAKTIGLLFHDWKDSEPADIVTSITTGAYEYEPGFFYKRELPCIMDLLSQTDLEEIDMIIIDGYVYLDGNKKPGLGHHLYKELNSKIPVIGVAKSAFFENHATDIVSEVLRGKSTKPLYITSEGIELSKASDMIKGMHGEFRMPTLLKLMDSLTKQ